MVPGCTNNMHSLSWGGGGHKRNRSRMTSAHLVGLSVTNVHSFSNEIHGFTCIVIVFYDLALYK